MNVALIPARGGSRGVPRKNIKLLNGKPLIAYTIEAALDCTKIDEVYVTTEDPEISEIAHSFGAAILPRPSILATDDVQMPEVCVFALRQAAEWLGTVPDLVIILTPTTPFRNSEHIRLAVERYSPATGGSVFAGYRDHRFHWQLDAYSLDPVNQDPHNRQGRQDIDDWLIAESGAIYVVGGEDMLRERDFRLRPFTFYPMTQEDSLDIDSTIDFAYAEFLMGMKEK